MKLIWFSLLLLVVALAYLVFLDRDPLFKVRVVDIKQQKQGHYGVQYEVLEPAKYAGLYGVGKTRRYDLVPLAIGKLYEVRLSKKAIPIMGRRLEKYAISAPQSKGGDFFEMAKPLD